MAEIDTTKAPTLAEQYLLKEKEEKLDMGTKPAEELEVKNPANATSEEDFAPKTEETPVVAGGNEVFFLLIKENEGNPAAADESSGASSAAAGESNEATQANAGESAEPEDSRDQEVEETPEIKLETAPADFRFPTTNQSRHCFTRYIKYHRCVAAKGEGALECDKFAKYYRSLCPGEWVDRWNEQRENSTFPGPL